MLSPKRTKHRKTFKGRRGGLAGSGAEVSFGEYGLLAVQDGWVTARQLEAARVAMTRKIKRGGRVWIRVFPDKPITQKPAETRQGHGKGNPEYWVANIQPGRIIYEMEGAEPEVMISALELASSKLPIKTKVVKKGDLA